MTEKGASWFLAGEQENDSMDSAEKLVGNASETRRDDSGRHWKSGKAESLNGNGTDYQPEGRLRNPQIDGPQFRAPTLNQTAVNTAAPALLHSFLHPHPIRHPAADSMVEEDRSGVKEQSANRSMRDQLKARKPRTRAKAAGGRAASPCRGMNKSSGFFAGKWEKEDTSSDSSTKGWDSNALGVEDNGSESNADEAQGVGNFEDGGGTNDDGYEAGDEAD
ncbi:hypothetical protein AGABI2DRAFT_143960 [Agaricus bisporus var. bisporus H97]|uniref:hypothetical protein n=1 Tax=Agaricus bisporus var. bisporus (strain H97 / ATCC MYA-4626 / FGSC 10389) TaxID=936046 RepID=UPI00029F5C8B|nr:hypothetical protein AGABI2DRAFT_143960 [Agaricus bisporus var. bisporus H97]EKV45519.1 hypothetical protein AGABI2DRAFT_143960 [Agaricus bisporus var. bisporus H97]